MYVDVYVDCAHTFIVSIGVCGDDGVVIVDALEHVDGHVVPAADEVAVTVDPYIAMPKRDRIINLIVVGDYSVRYLGRRSRCCKISRQWLVLPWDLRTESESR